MLCAWVSRFLIFGISVRFHNNVQEEWCRFTCGSSDLTETARGSGVSRTLEHSRSSFSFNTRSSSGIESFRAASKDMVVCRDSRSNRKSLTKCGALRTLGPLRGGSFGSLFPFTPWQPVSVPLSPSVETMTGVVGVVFFWSETNRAKSSIEFSTGSRCKNTRVFGDGEDAGFDKAEGPKCGVLALFVAASVSRE